MAELVVDGTASLKLANDQATIHVSLESKGKKRDRVVADFAKIKLSALTAMKDFVKDLDDPQAQDSEKWRVATTARCVEETYSWRSRGKYQGQRYKTGYRVYERWTVITTELEEAPELVEALTDVDGTEVSISYSVSQETSKAARVEIQRAAIKDAQAVAQAWADSVGLENVKLSKVVDSQSSYRWRTFEREPWSTSSGCSSSSCSSGSSTSSQSSETSRMFEGISEISATVSCVFTARSPSLPHSAFTGESEVLTSERG